MSMQSFASGRFIAAYHYWAAYMLSYQGMVGLISVIIGGQALIRSSRGMASGRPKAITALVMGLVAMVFSATAPACYPLVFGSGSGKAGAIVALVLGLVGAALGGLAFSGYSV